MPAKPDYERIADHYRAQIKAGKLKPGQKIPHTQPEIAAAFHCSIGPVRSAFMILEAEGLIVRRQGKGMFVADDEKTPDV